jgi:hypothetical protein
MASAGRNPVLLSCCKDSLVIVMASEVAFIVTGWSSRYSACSGSSTRHAPMVSNEYWEGSGPEVSTSTDM